MNMNILLLLLSVALTGMLFLGLRTMQEDHLFAIGHRIELCIWVMFALYLGSIVIFGTQSDLMRGVEVNTEATQFVKFLLAALLAARLFSVAAFTLGNPPRVRIEVQPRSHHVALAPATSTPGTRAEPDGSSEVLL